MNARGWRAVGFLLLVLGLGLRLDSPWQRLAGALVLAGVAAAAAGLWGLVRGTFVPRGARR